MALPVYANDLITVGTGDLNADAGVWDESSDGGYDTGGSMVDDEDLWYVDTLINTGQATSSCTAAQYTKDGTTSGAGGPGTILYNHNASFTVPTDGIVSVDAYWAAPPALNPYIGASFGVAEAGISVGIGWNLGDFDLHYVGGSDVRPPTDGVYSSYFVDPAVTPAGTVGTAGTAGTYTMVGVAIAAGAQARGNPFAVQSVRYGRGEVEYTLGEVANPATFAGYAIIDGAAADKFNLLQTIEGGYKGRGLMTFGTAATAVYFEDSNVSISIADDLKVGANFNAGVVNNALSELYWTNVNITNLGTVAKYTFTVNDSATTEHNTCVFTGLGTFVYGTNSTNINVTYRAQEVVRGGSYSKCTFDKSVATAATIAATLNDYTDCVFNSSGTGFGVDLTDGDTVTISANTTMNWDNTSTGYTDTAGNRTIKVNVDVGVTLTINNNTGDIIFVQNEGTGTVSIVTGQRTITFNISPTPTAYEYRIYTVTGLGSLAGAVEVQGAESTSGGSQAYTYSYAVGVFIAFQVFDKDVPKVYKESVSYFELADANTTQNINLEVDIND